MRRRHGMLEDVGLLTLRATFGGLMMGHGAQKLFGTFGGSGIQGTAGWLESVGLKPGRTWAMMAGGSEFGAGLLTTLGALSPIGPLSMWGPMLMAWGVAHTGKPIWVSSGGAEVPIVYLAISTALALTGPGRYSVDQALDIDIPTWMSVLTAGGVVAGVAVGLGLKNAAQQQAAGGAELTIDTDATTNATGDDSDNMSGANTVIAA